MTDATGSGLVEVDGSVGVGEDEVWTIAVGTGELEVVVGVEVVAAASARRRALSDFQGISLLVIGVLFRACSDSAPNTMRHPGCPQTRHKQRIGAARQPASASSPRHFIVADDMQGWQATADGSRGMGGEQWLAGEGAGESIT